MAEDWKSHESSFHPKLSDVHEVLASDGSTTVWLRVEISPHGASFGAAVLSDTERPIVLAEDEIDHPGNRWELRSSGLWADHNCETELEHWSYGLEAFALALDDAEQLVREGVGDRVPLGWELDFESEMPPEPLVALSGYTQRGVMHGVLLTRSGETTFEASAVRQHWWANMDHSGPDLVLDASESESGGSVLVPSGKGLRLVTPTRVGECHSDAD